MTDYTTLSNYSRTIGLSLVHPYYTVITGTGITPNSYRRLDSPAFLPLFLSRRKLNQNKYTQPKARYVEQEMGFKHANGTLVEALEIG